MNQLSSTLLGALPAADRHLHALILQPCRDRGRLTLSAEQIAAACGWTSRHQLQRALRSHRLPPLPETAQWIRGAYDSHGV